MGAIAIVTPFLTTCALESWSWKRRTSCIWVTVVGLGQTVIGDYCNKEMNLDHNRIQSENIFTSKTYNGLYSYVRLIAFLKRVFASIEFQK